MVRALGLAFRSRRERPLPSCARLPPPRCADGNGGRAMLNALVPFNTPYVDGAHTALH